MARQLKVFRLPIGFHDAYVAAASQKAALAAWGADADLFARGIAEKVADADLAPDLAREVLAHPGQVIRRSRGSHDEQIAALPPSPARKHGAPARHAKPGRKQAAPPPKPRPDRSAVDAAERAVTDLQSRQRAERELLADRQAALDRERRTLEKTQGAQTADARDLLHKARAAYDRAMRQWRA
jgi:hypothetical protein